MLVEIRNLLNIILNQIEICKCFHFKVQSQLQHLKLADERLERVFLIQTEDESIWGITGNKQ